MSQKTHGLELHRLKGVKRQSGNFTLDGVNSPSVKTGSGYTVSRTGVGAFSITFDGPYYKVLSVTANAQSPAGPLVPAFVQVVSVVQGASSAASVRVAHLEQNAVTKDFAAADNTGGKIYFTVDFLDIGAQ